MRADWGEHFSFLNILLIHFRKLHLKEMLIHILSADTCPLCVITSLNGLMNIESLF